MKTIEPSVTTIKKKGNKETLLAANWLLQSRHTLGLSYGRCCIAWTSKRDLKDICHSHKRAPSRFFKAQRQSNSSTAKAHSWPILSCRRITVIAVGLQTDGWGWSWGRWATYAARFLFWSCVVFQCGLGSHFKGMGCCAATNFLYGVPGWLEQDDVDLVKKDASQQPKTGCKYCDDLHGWNKLSIGTEICWDKRNPHNKKYKHAESDKFGLCEVFWKFTGFESKEETYGSQEACVSNKETKCHHGALVACDENNLIDIMVLVAGGRGIVKPNHAYHNLDKSAQKYQEELQI